MYIINSFNFNRFKEYYRISKILYNNPNYDSGERYDIFFHKCSFAVNACLAIELGIKGYVNDHYEINGKPIKLNFSHKLKYLFKSLKKDDQNFIINNMPELPVNDKYRVFIKYLKINNNNIVNARYLEENVEINDLFLYDLMEVIFKLWVREYDDETIEKINKTIN